MGSRIVDADCAVAPIEANPTLPIPLVRFVVARAVDHNIEVGFIQNRVKHLTVRDVEAIAADRDDFVGF